MILRSYMGSLIEMKFCCAMMIHSIFVDHMVKVEFPNVLLRIGGYSNEWEFIHYCPFCGEEITEELICIEEK